MKRYLFFVLAVLIESCYGFWKWGDKKKHEENPTKSSRGVSPVDIPIDLAFPEEMEFIEANEIVASGFISAVYATDDTPFMFKTISRNDRPFYPCEAVEFINLPSPNPSPFVGGPIFKLIKELYNGKFAWHNGNEYVSFVTNGGNDHGTWIVGSEPGVDSGYVFIKPNTETMVPLSTETSNVMWHWLMNSQWRDYADARLVCRDERAPAEATQRYFDIEYFDIDNSLPHHSYFIPDYLPQLNDENISSSDGIYLDRRHMKWIALKKLSVIAAMGQPSLLRESNKSPATIGHLVNEEHGSVGWRFTFRNALGFDSTKIETSFLYDRLGPKNGFSIARLSATQLDAYSTNMYNTLSTIVAGDFVWLWFSIDSTDADDDAVKDLSPGFKTERHDELLLECISVAGNRAVFSFYPSDRLKTMKRSILSKDTTFIIMERFMDGDKHIKTKFSIGSVELKVHGLYNIGSDVISMIKTYLNEKEGALGNMPSCFLYHAAVSLPRPLVYAAEIVCVLIGSKPVTMIQYVTPSDHQWKFPLVQSLVTKIMTAKLLHPDRININATVTTLGNDKTLILYRTNRQYLVDLLLPRGEAQALHPGPYPDQNNRRRSLEQQIFNAWWNGYVLGYPTSFVDSYCLNFHSDLTRDEKSVQINIAKAEAEKHFKTSGDEAVKIGAGLDPPVDDIIWSYL